MHKLTIEERSAKIWQRFWEARRIIKPWEDLFFNYLVPSNNLFFNGHLPSWIGDEHEEVDARSEIAFARNSFAFYKYFCKRQLDESRADEYYLQHKFAVVATYDLVEHNLLMASTSHFAFLREWGKLVSKDNDTTTIQVL